MSDTFIPLSRHELVDRLCASKAFKAEERNKFQQFCEILSAYAHFVGQKDLELMKLAFSHFDPNADRVSLTPIEQSAHENTAQEFAEAFSRTARRANFHPLGEHDIRAALNKASIVPVQTSVDFDAFERFEFYFRTSNEIDVTIKRWWRKKKLTVGNYDRMATLLQLKESTYFAGTDDPLAENLKPGKIYLNLYKNIPHHDLELLFPNLQISMNLKDKLMLGVPALGAAVPLGLKILPSVGLLIGAIALFVFGFELGGRFSVDAGDGKAVFALLTAVLSISLALGGFAAGQWLKYKSRRLEFLKKVTDVLFFKSLDIGKGVLNALIDSAEEEECKEMMLVFFILLQSEKALKASEIDLAAEQWLQSAIGARVNFDVDKALDKLTEIRSAESNGGAIVELDETGAFRAVGIDDAKSIIDNVWDNAFSY